MKNEDEKLAIEMTKSLQKAQKKNAKEDKFLPLCVDLYSWCEVGNVSDFYNLIRRRILEELEEEESDGTLGDHVFFRDDLYRLYLDNDGIFLLSHILNGYFGVEQVRVVWRDIREKNKKLRIIYDFKKAVETYPTEKLKELLPQLEELEKQYEGNDFSEILREELSKRKRKSIFFLRKRRGDT